jgi:hypothetical protein
LNAKVRHKMCYFYPRKRFGVEKKMVSGHTQGSTITYCPAIKVVFRVGFYEGKNCPQSSPRRSPGPCLFEPVKRRNAWPFLHTIRRPRIYFYRLQKAAFYYDLIYLYLLVLYRNIVSDSLVLLLLLYFFQAIIYYTERFKKKKKKNDRFLFNIETV